MKTVVLTYCESAVKAHRIQDVLKGQGIDSILENETVSQMLPVPEFDVRILVDERDLNDAEQVLRDMFPEKME